LADRHHHHQVYGQSSGASFFATARISREVTLLCSSPSRNTCWCYCFCPCDLREFLLFLSSPTFRRAAFPAGLPFPQPGTAILSFSLTHFAKHAFNMLYYFVRSSRVSDPPHF
jgi:hypothetical protein